MLEAAPNSISFASPARTPHVGPRYVRRRTRNQDNHPRLLFCFAAL